jgi:alkylation response protein AidB-like acyl-CoA dehydrogenase
MDWAPDESERKLIEAARAFAADHIAPHAESWELERRVPSGIFTAAAKAGLTGILVPRAAGGAGAGYRTACRIVEVLAAADFAVTFALWVHGNVSNGIARNGTPEQVARFVPAMLAGERVGAFCLTEPGAGSDATAITTRARPIDDGFEITGDKAWITNGAVADVFVVYAQTDPALGWRGIAAFIVDGEPSGLARGTPYTMLGGHAMGVTDLTFAASPVPGADVLLGPGDGFKGAMAGITMARVFVAAACCGMLADSLRTAIHYGAGRQAFGKSILSFQGLQWELADVATDLEAARRLTEHAAAALDAGEQPVTAAAHAKKFATRAAMAGVAACMQAMGAAGLKTEHPLARHLAAAKAAEYLDGTTQIQNVIIARALFKEHGIDVG